MKSIIALLTLSVSALFYSQSNSNEFLIKERNDASAFRYDSTTPFLSGFFQTHQPQNFPIASDGWWYLLDTRHNSDPSYAMQFSGSFFNQELWFRKIHPNNMNQAWNKILMENSSGKVGVNLGADLPRENLEIDGNIRIGKDNNNSWIFHAPNDSRRSLFIAPFLSTGEKNWEKQTVFKDGNIAVNGKLEAQEVKVTQSPTADFVFEEDYVLRRLEEVEKHIKAKKHLPEIASAKEMEKEGVNVGEFQIKLLQKIEELTLYSIEQNKQIKSQSDYLKTQSEEIQAQSEKIKSLESENYQIRRLFERVEKLEKNTK